MKKLSYTGFTLIEIMIVIAIIAVIATTGTKINFNAISDSQYLRIFTGKIVSTYETVRNNLLIGKSIDSFGTVGTSWKIEIPVGSGKTLKTYYSTGGTFLNYTAGDYQYKPTEGISKINCYTSTGTTATTVLSTGTGVITITNSSISFSGTTNGTTPCNTTTTKRLILETFYHNNTGSLEINGLNGLTLGAY